jgi:hypothetical protein
MAPPQLQLTSFIPPYRPFRGAPPPHFVERFDAADFGAPGITAAALSAWAAGPASPRFHQLVVSAPAMGKTALLRDLCKKAESHLGWLAFLHRCLPKESALAAVASELLAGLARRWPWRKGAVPWVGSPRAGLGQWAGGPGPQLPPAVAPALALMPEQPAHPPAAPGASGGSPWAALKSALWLAGEQARERRSGVLVAFDDADLLSDGEGELLGHLARSLSRDALPVALLLSGGEDLARRYARSANFSGAVWPVELGPFDGVETREALVVPAAERGVHFEGEALELLSSASAGSPLQVQRLGFATWTAAKRTGTVTSEDAQQAVALVMSLAAAGTG